MHGLALRALSSDRFDTLAIGGGTSFLATVQASITAHRTDNLTHAYVDAGGKVNESATSPEQVVDLLAWDATEVDGLAGAFSQTSLVGIGVGADGGLLKKDTQAAVKPTATVRAARQIVLAAFSDEDVLSIAGSADIGGAFVGAAAALSGYLVQPTTIAHASRARVTAPNVLLHAEDANDVDQLAVSVATAGIVSGGAAIAGVRAQKVTEASVAAGGVVNADGSGAAITVADRDAAGAPTTVDVRGLALRALAHDDFDALVIGGDAGIFNFQISAIAHNTDNVTRAFVADQASVNAAEHVDGGRPGRRPARARRDGVVRPRRRPLLDRRDRRRCRRTRSDPEEGDGGVRRGPRRGEPRGVDPRAVRRGRHDDRGHAGRRDRPPGRRRGRHPHPEAGHAGVRRCRPESSTPTAPSSSPPIRARTSTSSPALSTPARR